MLSKRGMVLISIGISLAVFGALLLDNSYNSVESLMKLKHDLFVDKIIMPQQSVNSTIPYNQLAEHNVLVVHVKSESDSIKLVTSEPNNQTFEKVSSNGFIYHIMDKSAQTGDYFVSIFNLNNDPVTVNAIYGEDPYLSGKCFETNGVSCYAIPMAIGLVIIGVIIFILGGMLIFTDYRKPRSR